MINTIFNLLLANTLVFSVLFACVMLVRGVFKTKLSAKMQYSLWIIVIIKLLLPVSFNLQWSPYALIQSAQTANMSAIDKGIGIILNDNLLVSALRSLSGAGITTLSETVAARVIQIDLKTLALCIWIAGAMYYAVWVGFRSFQLKMRIRRCGNSNVPKRMVDEFQRCKKELGINRNIEFIMQGCLPVPAIMGALRPVLLLPEKLAYCMDIEQLRHVFIHELMHYKRKDLWTIWILNIINAVYWFNPLTWLCIRLIYRDMETACDGMVVETVGTSNRKAYIETILYFSGKQRAMRIHAAMSLNDGCAKMQKRIMGMYLAKKTKRSIRIAVALMACVLAFMGFTWGFDSVPENNNYKSVYVWSKPSYHPDNALRSELQNTLIYSGSMTGVTIGNDPYETLRLLERKKDAVMILVNMK